MSAVSKKSTPDSSAWLTTALDCSASSASMRITPSATREAVMPLVPIRCRFI